MSYPRRKAAASLKPFPAPRRHSTKAPLSAAKGRGLIEAVHSTFVMIVPLCYPRRKAAASLKPTDASATEALLERYPRRKAAASLKRLLVLWGLGRL